MHIAFIYPALPFDKEHHFEALPIGLLYLTAVAQKAYGTKVDIFDSRYGPALPEISRVNQYDVIGFTAMTMQVNHALEMARQLKIAGYKGKLVFGGPHASVAADHLKKQAFIDAIFIGESEDTFLKYLDFLEGGSAPLERVWIRNSAGSWEKYSGNTYIKNLDTIPFPARDKYARRLPIRSINITTTRGCPFKCNYCQPSKQILFGKSVRRRSVDNIISEIEDAVDQFNITQFSIDDDTFTFDKKMVLDFCKKVKRFGFNWSCQSRSDIDRETLKKMHAAGCNLIFVGVESGSQRILNLMNKKNTVKRNADFIKTCNEIGIKAWCNMMIGYPGETIDDMKKSLEFVRQTKPSRVGVNQVTPFPGTNLWTTHRHDLIARSWDDIARHVQKPKFKSMADKQWFISYYTILMTKHFDQPLLYDVIRSSKLLSAVSRFLPYLFRFPSIVPLLRKISLNKRIIRFFFKPRVSKS